ncbi:hypothetical protein HanXRQr2_Chr14g0662481 [Helianthus annuus]|uniref:Uncharacterized protein n=1 Tax=Helianthus annuus TaxID=4232 RepID=A0A9K3ED67_HELAN|nr:hypothetical protein HanXRQr2_Chr14g0662481 [Helianthus annuus]
MLLIVTKTKPNTPFWGSWSIKNKQGKASPLSNPNIHKSLKLEVQIQSKTKFELRIVILIARGLRGKESGSSSGQAGENSRGKGVL